MKRKSWIDDSIGIENGVLTFYKNGEPLIPYMPTNEEMLEAEDWRAEK